MVGPFAGSESGEGLKKQTVVAVESIDPELLARWVEEWRAAVAAKLAEDTSLARPLQADWSAEAQWMRNVWTLRLRSAVWGERYREWVVRHPDGWWQALRQRFAPRWWLKRYPVREVVHTVSPRIIYPQLKIAMPEPAHVLHLEHAVRREPDTSDDE